MGASKKTKKKVKRRVIFLRKAKECKKIPRISV